MKVAALFSMMTIFAGCETASDFHEPPLAPTVSPGAFPEIPAADRASCARPGYRAGQNALTVIKRHEVAIIECNRKRKRIVDLYDDTRTALTEPPPQESD